MALAENCCVVVSFFIRQILNIKSTNPVLILSSAVLLNLCKGNFRTGGWLFYCLPVETTAKPAVFFVVPDRVNIRILP